MLKFATIYSLCITVLEMGCNLKNMLKGKIFYDRLVNFLALLMTFPMLYVFIKVLQML